VRGGWGGGGDVNVDVGSGSGSGMYLGNLTAEAERCRVGTVCGTVELGLG
jgi:hypothetical protein